MELPQKFLNLLVIIIPLIFFVSVFFFMEWRQRKARQRTEPSQNETPRT
ncbi:hypothetical protein Bdt_0704 [Bdellovibrio bacteriovorus str. Tiberius]|uniref:Uncharacterized protein n=1 Tax=Bdellovibrio bacteriovorus str. Tiberius TaxID=1069642 RepID=K7YKZ7_BDEBC|nr:hypothetical protein Bdt_0704 [Bdellovibrio bacteriovorus str. Tiberius]